MKSLRIKGFRTIRDSGTIELKPITAIIGQNSCGKSSFIRFFPLLKQSTEREISETLLWFGEYVDFGNFKSIKPNFDGTLKTSFETEIDFFDIYRRPFFRRRTKNQKDFYVKLNFQIEEKYISYLCFSYFDQKVELFLDESYNVLQIIVNGLTDLLENSKYNWFKNPHFLLPFIKESKSNDDDYIFFTFDKQMEKRIINTLGNLLPDETNEETKENLIDALTEFRSQTQLHEFLCKYKNIPEIANYFKTHNKEDETFKKLNAYSILAVLPYILQIINRSLLTESENIHYLKPIRASANRYYRIQGLNIEHVDSDGSNLAMILYNLSDEERQSFEEWTLENFNIKFSVGKDSGHASLIIYDNNHVINLADTGYGYSQILPIILELWLLLKRKINEKHITVVIEQPELHLHPAFQAKVIDLFVQLIKQAKAKDVDLKIIFETHSETMINRLGQRIYKKEISSDDVNILAFEKINNETHISSKTFTENGLIKDWPVGFFSMEE